MTQTQVNFWQQQETVRQNKRLTDENRRHNERMEELNMLDLLEKQRANRAAEANSRYAAEQSFLGSQAKAEATKYSADRSSSTKRAEIIAGNKQRTLDREQQAALKQAELQQAKEIADVNAGIAKDANNIKRDTNSLTEAKNENDFQIAKDNLEAKWESLKQQADVNQWNKAKFIHEFGLEKDKFAHQKWEDFQRNLRQNSETLFKGIDSIVKAIDTLAFGDSAQAATGAINSFMNIVNRPTGGRRNG